MSHNSEGLTSKIVSSGRWTAASAAINTFFQLVQLAVLGRFLSPTDFGQMTTMMVVIGAANLLSDFGVSNYLVQVKVLPSRLFFGLVILCVIWSSAIATAVILLAAPIADYYEVPILAELLPVLAAGVIVAAMGQPIIALLQRELKFQTIAVMDMLSGFAGLVAASALAAMGKGVWALIGSQLIISFVKIIGGAIAVFPVLKFEPNEKWPGLKDAIRFGRFQTGERLLNFIGWNIDKVVIGKILGPSALGAYSVACQLVLRPISVLNPVFTRVAFPVLARVQDDDERLIQGYLKLIKIVAVVQFPIYMLLIIASDPIVALLLGERWSDTSGILSILGGLGFVFSLGNPIGTLLLAKGRADLGFYYNVISVIVYGLAIAFGSVFGIRGVAFGFLAAAAGILFPIEFWLRWHLVRMSFASYFAAIARIAAGALIPLAIAEIILKLFIPIPYLLVAGMGLALAAVLAYGCSLWFSERSLLQECFKLLFRRSSG